MEKIRQIKKRLSLVSTGTWLRLGMLITGAMNAYVKNIGPMSPAFDKTQKIVSFIVFVIAAAVAYWKNNSFTQAALDCDKMMKVLKEGKYDRQNKENS
ncbi:MAG: SPP1 phage holin family protein [Clostridiales bacterium]|nr:SPP1 phage holin family protein [Clostridiales bacterium]